jgi:hypothetical protein
MKTQRLLASGLWAIAAVLLVATLVGHPSADTRTAAFVWVAILVVVGILALWLR